MKKILIESAKILFLVAFISVTIYLLSLFFNKDNIESYIELMAILLIIIVTSVAKRKNILDVFRDYNNK